MRLTTRRLARGFAAAIFGVAMVAATPRVASTQQGLTIDELLEMRKKGVSSRQVLRYVQEYCIAFAMNDSIGHLVTDAGGDAQLVAGLRSACTTEAPLAHIVPGMLLDADLSVASALGNFASSDRLCTARFEKSGLRLSNQRRNGGCVIGYPADPFDGPLRIELTISELGSPQKGAAVLGFGRDGEAWNHYAFSIDSDHRAELCVNVRDTCRRLLARTRVTSIQTARGNKNRMQVEIRGRQVSLAINGQPLATYNAESPVVGTLVLGVGPLTSVVFERLSAQSLIGERSTARLP